MNLTYRRRLAVLLAALATAACEESITAPGACPEYCPGTSIEIVDSLLAGSVVSDTTYTGYVTPWGAGTMHLAGDPGGTGPRSRGVIRFAALSERLAMSSSDTTTAVAATDSLRIRLNVRRRLASATGLAVGVYRLPSGVDSLVAFSDLDPAFLDTARVGAIGLPDTLVADTVGAVFPGSAFPDIDTGDRVVAVGLVVEGAPEPAFVDLLTAESGAGATLVRYATIDSAGTPVTRTEGRDRPELDLYVGTGLPAAASTSLTVGGAPSSRSFLDFALPAAVLDSGEIVRATLVLVPAGPVVGAVGDTVIMVAHSIPADFGPKSPFNLIHPDSVSARSSYALVGSADTVSVDVTDILRRWHLAPAEPRVILLRATPEGGSLAEARFGAMGTPGAPMLIVTYVPPLRFGR